MIPDSSLNTLVISDDTETSQTYKITSENVRGYINELEALKQAIYKVLNTERYEYPIYSFSYGIDTESLAGKDSTYVRIELKRRIQECLLQDERIRTVDNFQFSSEGDVLTCAFDVTSMYGNLMVVKEVST